MSIYFDHEACYRFVLDLSKNNNKIRKTVNLPESEKVEAVRIQEEHLILLLGERENYKRCCEEVKVHNRCLYLEDSDFTFGCEPCSFNGTMHYSYDYMPSSCIILILSNLVQYT